MASNFERTGQHKRVRAINALPSEQAREQRLRGGITDVKPSFDKPFFNSIGYTWNLAQFGITNSHELGRVDDTIIVYDDTHNPYPANVTDDEQHFWRGWAQWFMSAFPDFWGSISISFPSIPKGFGEVFPMDAETVITLSDGTDEHQVSQSITGEMTVFHIDDPHDDGRFDYSATITVGKPEITGDPLHRFTSVEFDIPADGEKPVPLGFPAKTLLTSNKRRFIHQCDQ